MVCHSVISVYYVSIYHHSLLSSFISFDSLTFSPPVSLSLSHNAYYMEPLSEEEEEELQLDRVNSLPDTELASTSSGLSFTLTTEDCRSTSSSGDISTSSGEIPVIVVEEAVVPKLVDPVHGLTTMITTRRKCVGRNNQRLNWGFSSVIGRRKEMEDAVAVRPAFMSCTCNHVGGCTSVGSRTSSDISPVHFFGVYDGHGGSQVHTFLMFGKYKI